MEGIDEEFYNKDINNEDINNEDINSDYEGKIEVVNTHASIEELRSYQKYILNTAINQNTIAFMPTGSGKTLIAVNLIIHRLECLKMNSNIENLLDMKEATTNESFNENITINKKLNKKSIVFITPTKVLVGQQSEYISQRIGPLGYKVNNFTGESLSRGHHIDNWPVSEWNRQIDEYDVMIFIPEIFKHALQHALIHVSSFDCIILDECHHAIGKHPMNVICTMIKESGPFETRPRMLGLTASPLKCRKGKILDKISELEDNMYSKLVCPQELLIEFYEEEKYGIEEIMLLRYKSDESSDPIKNNLFPNELNAIEDISMNASSNTTADELRNKLLTLSLNKDTLLSLKHTHARVRYADLLKSLYRIIDVLNIDMQELSTLIDNPYVLKLSPVISDSSSQGLLEIKEMIGQNVEIIDSCGLICGIITLKMIFNDESCNAFLISSKEANDDDNIETKHYASKSFFNQRQEENNRKKKSGSVSILDIDNISLIVTELEQCPFNLAELEDSYYVTVCCLLDNFAIISSTLSLKICSKSLQELTSLEFGNSLFERLQQHTNQITNNLDINTSFSLNYSELIYYILYIIHKNKLAELDNDSTTFIPITIQVGSIGILESLSNLVGFPLVLVKTNGIKDLKHYLGITYQVILKSIDRNELRRYMSLEQDSIEDYTNLNVNNNDSIYIENIINLEDRVRDNMSSIIIEPKPKQVQLITNKVRSLCQLWNLLGIANDRDSNNCNNMNSDTLDDANNNSIDWACIVFCKMRFSAITLCQLINMINEHNSTDIVTSISPVKCVKPSYLVGGGFLKNQLQCLSEFQERITNVLFTTDIAEEGLHIRACDVVIHFDQPSSVKSYIQRRGRARARVGENRRSIYLTPIGDEGDIVITDIKSLQDQDKKLLSCAAKNNDDITTNNSRIESINNNEDATLHDTLQVIIQNRLNNDTINDVVAPSSSNSERYKYVIKESGAEVDLVSSLELLYRYCQHLPHDEFYTPKPVFWMDKKKVKILEKSSIVYQCSVLLPASVASHIRCITGPCSYNKSDAKGITAMLCIKNLREEGEFNEWFQPSCNGGPLSNKQIKIQRAEYIGDNIHQNNAIPSNFCRKKSTDKVVKKSIDSSEEIEITKDVNNYKSEGENNNNNNMVDNNMFNDSSFQEIFVKSIPDFLKPPLLDMNIDGDVETNNDTTLLFLYAIRAVCINDLSFQSITQCPDCSEHLKAINHLGLGFLSKLPAEILDTPFNFSLHDINGMLVKLQFIQSRQVTNDELLQMQRFHQAICCWESENETNSIYKEDNNQYFDMTSNSMFNSVQTSIRDVPMSIHEWTASSNNAYYIAFPLPEEINTVHLPTSMPSSNYSNPFYNSKIDIPSHAYINVDKELEMMDINNQSNDWLAFLKESADGAQHLVNNLTIQKKRNDEDVKYATYCPGKVGSITADNLIGQVFAKGSHELYVGGIAINRMKYQPRVNSEDIIDCNDYLDSTNTTATLGDIIKYIKIDDSNLTTKDFDNINIINNTSSNNNLIPVTFHDWILNKNIDWIEKLPPDSYYLNPALAKDHKLIAGRHMSSKLTLTQLLGVARKIEVNEDQDQERQMPKKIKKKSQLNINNQTSQEILSNISFEDNIGDIIGDNRNDSINNYDNIVSDNNDDASMKSNTLHSTHDSNNDAYNHKNKSKSNKNKRKSSNLYHQSHCDYLYFIPECCNPLGAAKWMYMGLALPSITWRIQSLLFALEARQYLSDSFSNMKEIKKIINFDDDNSSNCGNIDGNVDEIMVDNSVDSYFENKLPSGNTTTITTSELHFDSITPSSDDNIWSKSNIISDTVKLPDISSMLESITPKMANEGISSERMEMLGDSLLKLVTTVEIFKLFPNRHEGFLTEKRMRYISNKNLFDSAMSSNITEYLRIHCLSSGKAKINDIFKPPGMTLSIDKSIWNLKVASSKKDQEKKREKDREIKRKQLLTRNFNITSESDVFDDGMTQIVSHHKAFVKDKLLSDLIEALIGAFYINGGLQSGIAVIKLFGLWPRLTDFTSSDNSNSNSINNPNRENLIRQQFNLLQMPIPITIPSNYPVFLERLANSNLDYDRSNNSIISIKTTKIDKIIIHDNLDHNIDNPTTITKQEAIFKIFGYKFKNLILLEESLTHCSVTQRTNNQRLEFLGDAVLDFTLVSMLYKSQNWATEGDLSQQKTNVTNNKFLAILGARLKLHYLLDYASSHLQDEINKLIKIDIDYEEYDQRNNYDITCKYDGRYDEMIVPKPLADVIEAVIGAIFIDCNGSLSTILQIISHIHLLPPINN